MPTLVDFNEIEAERKALGVSVETLAQRADIAPSTYYNLRRGKHGAQQKTTHAILAALKVLRAERAGKPPPARAKKKPSEVGV